MTRLLTSVRVCVLRYPVRGTFKFFVAAPGQTPERTTVVVQVTDDAGNCGYGQAGT